MRNILSPAVSVLAFCATTVFAGESVIQRSVKTASYVSFDNGKSWDPGHFADEHFADDPTCAYGPDGTAYMITKTNMGSPKTPFASDADFISIRRSQ